MDNQDSQKAENSPVCENIKLNQISLPVFQPRRYFDEDAMAELRASIQQHGILQPILLRPLGENQYELVAGERRYKAAKTLGLTEVPVIVRQMSKAEAMQYALMENLQREDLNPVEETEGILQLLELSLNIDSAKVISLLNQMANHNRGLTDNVIRKEEREVILSVFQSVGRFSPESFRTNRLPLLNLPKAILEALRQGRIEYTKAKTIAKVKDEQFREELLDEAIAQALSLSQIKERIRQYQAEGKPAASTLRSQIDAVYVEMKKSKVWDDPHKRESLEALLTQMRGLLSEE